MGIVRAWAAHKRWSNSEIEVLREHYATAEMNLLEEMLPGGNLFITSQGSRGCKECRKIHKRTYMEKARG